MAKILMRLLDINEYLQMKIMQSVWHSELYFKSPVKSDRKFVEYYQSNFLFN